MCKHSCQKHDEILKHGKLNVHFQIYMWQTELTGVSVHKYFCCYQENRQLGNLDCFIKYEYDFLPYYGALSHEMHSYQSPAAMFLFEALCSIASIVIFPQNLAIQLKLSFKLSFILVGTPTLRFPWCQVFQRPPKHSDVQRKLSLH